MRVVSFKADEELIELMEKVAQERGISVSELIRTAIRAYLLDHPPCKPYVTRRIVIRTC